MSDDTWFVELSNGLAKMRVDMEKSIKWAVNKLLQEAIQNSHEAEIQKMQQLFASHQNNLGNHTNVGTQHNATT